MKRCRCHRCSLVFYAHEGDYALDTCNHCQTAIFRDQQQMVAHLPTGRHRRVPDGWLISGRKMRHGFMLKVTMRNWDDENVMTECEPICSAVAAAPGVMVKSGTWGAEHPVEVYFTVTSSFSTSLAFITWSVDPAMWPHGHEWAVIAHAREDLKFPVGFKLHSGSVRGGRAISQSLELVEFINHLINREEFLAPFGLDSWDFRCKEYRP